MLVRKDGLGDFTSVVDAVKSINDSSETNIYDIYIYEGEYDIVKEYFGEKDYTDTNDKGLILPDYVNLIGLGDRDKVILKGEMPDSIKYRTSQSFSTLNTRYNNNICNLTITAYNCRYPMHDQTTSLSKDCVRYVKIVYSYIRAIMEPLIPVQWTKSITQQNIVGVVRMRMDKGQIMAVIVNLNIVCLMHKEIQVVHI